MRLSHPPPPLPPGDKQQIYGYNVFIYLCESLNSVGVVKSTCTLYAAQLEYQTVAFKIDYTYMEKYLDPNVVTMAL